MNDCKVATATRWSPEKSADVRALPGSIRDVIDTTLTHQRDHFVTETLSGQYASWTVRPRYESTQHSSEPLRRRGHLRESDADVRRDRTS